MTATPNHHLSTGQRIIHIMFLQFVLLAALVALAVAEPMYHHHSHGYHHHGHDDYHHDHHGYHTGHHGHHGYHGHHGHHGYHGHHGHLGYHDDHHDHGYDHHHDNIDYKFKYEIKDPKHYNYQSREEYKDGKNVYGTYSLQQPDGKTRIVKYKADHYGFHADVDYKGGYKHDEYKHDEYKPSYGHHDSHYKH